MIFPASRTTLIYGKDSTGNDVPIGVGAGAQAAGTLTSDNTVAANGETVTIDGRVYTFKTALTSGGVEGEVLIVAADADNTLLNLINAINASGAKLNGTDYFTKLLTGHPSVTAATSVTAHAFAITARDAGALGNSIATTETSAHLSWGATTLVGGLNAQLFPDLTNGEYETVAASATAQVLGGNGATGDWLSSILVIPATTSPGNILLLDGSTSITVFTGGATSVSNLVPFVIPIMAKSTTGPWKITTGANVSVIATGNFT